MANRGAETRGKNRGLKRPEWVALAVFAGIGVLALPLVKDSYLLQQVWVSMCTVIGLQ